MNVYAKIVSSKYFQHSITAVILLAAVLVGFQTNREVVREHGELLDNLDLAIIAIFTIEIAIRILAYRPKYLDFFKNAWNNFDFVIVLLCILPFGAEYFAVVRIARVLRVLRIVSVIPKLQLLVGVLLKSIPSIGYIALLLLIYFYVYACIGTFTFGENDPLHFGTLGRSMLTLFEVITLEGWTEIMYTQFYGSHVWPTSLPDLYTAIPQAMPITTVIYFVSFILIGTMIILNLFIAVIINELNELYAEFGNRKSKVANINLASTKYDELIFEIKTLREEIDKLGRQTKS